MNLIKNSDIKTINMLNITEQLNDITELINNGITCNENNSSGVIEKELEVLRDKLQKLETDIGNCINEAYLEYSLKDVINKIDEKLKKLDFETKMNDTIDFKINDFKNIFKGEIDSDLDGRFSSALTNLNNDYVKLNSNNTINGENTFNYPTNFVGNVNITGNVTLPKLSEINSSKYKLDNIDIITKNNDNNILIGSKNNTTILNSNKLITQELTLNGVNVNLSDYATNDNLIKQIEKVIGLTYDGNVQDSKNKTVGKFYYDDINKYFYECIVDNNLTYVDNSKFRPVSNKTLSDKLYSNDLLDLKVYTRADLLNFDRDLDRFVHEIVLIVYGKLAIYSGYLRNIGNQLLDINGKICSFPVKSKYGDIWTNSNFIVRNVGNNSILTIGGYYTYSKTNIPFHFQGVFITE